MATPNDIVWEIEPHTLAKHEILKSYLSAWFPILGKYNKRVIYIDGFSGPGKYKEGEDGSPIHALREALKNSDRLKNTNVSFLFMDERDDRINHLRSELSQWTIPKNFQIAAVAGEFDKGLKSLLDNLEKSGSQLAPTFAFIDPFGWKGVPFELVKRLLNNPKTEVFINLMADSINRWLTHPSQKTRQHLVDLFGTEEVIHVAEKSENRITELRLLYQRQLSLHAEYVRFFEMKNTKNRPIYYLFFATNHRLGHKKMKEAFWKVDSSSGFQFSDATNPDQLVLLHYDEHPKLAKLLKDNFQSQKVLVSKVERFVDDETLFIRKNMGVALKLLESQQEIAVEEYKDNGKKRRKGTFPNDAIVNF